MVFCTYCGQSFIQNEHLEKHILTHTNVKPFRCFSCHMSFTRHKFLQRHYKVHGRDTYDYEGMPSNASIIPKSADRTPVACSNCAKTKTKCDRAFPCIRCARQKLQCTLRPTRRTSKHVNRVTTIGEITRSGSSETGNTGFQNNASGNSPMRHGDALEQIQQQVVAAQSPSIQVSHGQTQSLLSLQPLSTAHSRIRSNAEPAQQLQNLPPEKHLQLPIATTMPPFLEQSLPNGISSTGPSGISPLTTPTNEYIPPIQISNYKDVSWTGQIRSDETIPRFLMDPLSAGQESTDPTRIEPSLMMSTNMDMVMHPLVDGILGMVPEMSPVPTFWPVQTPAPRMDELISDQQFGSSASMFCPSNRQQFTVDAGVPDLGAIIPIHQGQSLFSYTPTIPLSYFPVQNSLDVDGYVL